MVLFSRPRCRGRRTVSRIVFLVMGLLFLWSIGSAMAWEWSDWNRYWGTTPSSSSSDTTATTPLSLFQVKQMRTRDIKRRLARMHGYSAEELAKYMDKKELIETLSFEEEKVRLKNEQTVKRELFRQLIIATIVTVVVSFCMPLLRRAYEIAHVNAVVYIDRKLYEVYKCRELHSYKGFIGVIIMGIFDMLQVWLTITVLLSWFMKPNRYFFPIPRLTISPAQLLTAATAAGGGTRSGSSSSKLSQYGINLGSMLITWMLRFIHGRVESYTGRALARAQKRQRKQQKSQETPEERAARKRAQRQAKWEKQQQQQQRTPTSFSADWMRPIQENTNATTDPPTIIHSKKHQDFMQEMDESSIPINDQNGDDDDNGTPPITTSQLDELD